ncbi:phosphoribosylformylglycinamidine synthase subunit PurS [Leptospira ognonensis]|uniref:Phosphoribosylformylglycinamidine synthase subunit PurS n=1 Tax=Leptospira ognonensis TaxID=2484945 RepID=A0A4V3JQX5_9LEPT|nr:phosphoribosylformylglycinamidine synthase subunit PurS [Leptospira ognonensis]TGL57276.1 phosphoribosylformylglycinamidine synthase subunit PurS [Leptospira ognonensis]
MFIVKINITLKDSVLDPQGQTVLRALHDQGKDSIFDVRVGKYIEVKIDTQDKQIAEKHAIELCESVLVNQVIETFRYTVEKI